MNFTKYVDDKKELIIEKTMELLQIPSLITEFDETSENPFGKPINDALHYMINLGKEDGFVVENFDNYACHIEYGEGEEVLGILGHLDVVPVGDESKWTNHPFEPTIRNGAIYARGAMDDKGPSIAAYMALLFLKEQGFMPKKKVRIILGTDEETKMRGVKYYLERAQLPDIGFAPDANFPLIYGEKGIMQYYIKGNCKQNGIVSFKSGERFNVVPDLATIVLEKDHDKEFDKFLTDYKYTGFKKKVSSGYEYSVEGLNAHAMVPHKGVNAGYLLCQFIDLYTDIENDFIDLLSENFVLDHYGYKLDINHYDEEMKELTSNVGIYEYKDSKYKIGVNYRYPRGWNKEESLQKIKESIADFNAEFIMDEDKEIHYVDINSDLVQTLLRVYRKHNPSDLTEPMTIGGGTYARTIKTAVAYGPYISGREDTIHQIDEYILIEDLLLATKVYMEAIYELTK